MQKLLIVAFLIVTPCYTFGQKTPIFDQTYTLFDVSRVVCKHRIYEWRIDGVSWRSYTTRGNYTSYNDTIWCSSNEIRLFNFNKKVQSWDFVYETPPCVYVQKIYKRSDGEVVAQLTNGEEQVLRKPEFRKK